MQQIQRYDMKDDTTNETRHFDPEYGQTNETKEKTTWRPNNEHV